MSKVSAVQEICVVVLTVAENSDRLHRRMDSE